MASVITGTSSKILSFEAIEYLVHHMFLPPKLPQKDDFDLKHETILLDTTFDSLLKFKKLVTSDQKTIIDSAIAMIQNLRAVRNSVGTESAIVEVQLGSALRDLCQKGGTIPLHVRAQNACVMIGKVQDSINVEVFELSPLNQSVIITKGRLRRCFPGPAISLSNDVFQQPGFQGMIAHTLAKMSHQPAVETRPQAKKAGWMHDEDRDTRHPKMVTELFVNVLKSVGEIADVTRLWKNTREEVMWLDSLLPWRRSPMWLLVRVALQLHFSRSTVPLNSLDNLYKTFMIFLMGQVLELSHQHQLPSDLWSVMNAKLARRLHKLDLPVDRFVLEFVGNIMYETNKLIQARWSTFIKQEIPCHDLSRIECLNFGPDVFSTLPALDDYIKSLTKRENKRFSAAFQPVSGLVKYQVENLPTCPSSSNKEYMAYNLRAFEVWVALNLSRWLQHHRWNANTCAELGDLIQTYHNFASPVYSGNPEAYSAMLLTILELWIACDQSATHACELLKDYDPGIPQELFQSLILPFKFQMERLLRAEDYLNRRSLRARFRAPCIIQDFGLPHSFSVEYFNQSREHKNLLEMIESQAIQTRHEKFMELQQKMEEYKTFMRLHDESICEYHEVVTDTYNDFCEQRHNTNCKKCYYKSRAASMDIEIHEWPLPNDPLEAQSTVFELEVPRPFGHWRDTTVFFLSDVLKAEYVRFDVARENHHLHSYKGLSSSFTSFGSIQRIGLLSQEKPHERSHRRRKTIATATESDVCLQNGLRYQYYDNKRRVFVRDFRVSDEIPILCTYKLPARSVSLQRFLFRPPKMPSGPPPNTVIATQSDCPDHMLLHEYKALSTIPLGYLIQWQNILLQLSAPSVDFKRVETGLVILQSIYQAGPGGDVCALRASHQVVDSDNFAETLLRSLYEASQRLKENWESCQALSTFISLGTRLLSLTSAGQTRVKCFTYLASVRSIAFGWVNLLRKKANRVTNDTHRTELTSKSVEIALICANSFNVDEAYLDDILAIPEDSSVFIQCSIFIQEGDCTISKTSDPIIPILQHRWKCLSYLVYPILAKRIVEDRSRSLDDAILKCWSAYQAGDNWQVVSEQFDYWLSCRTAPQDESDPLLVHFNLLTGQLLVNGLPLARLPSKYEQHPTYRTLFGHSVLDVMPTAFPGMQFSGRNKYAGFTLHLGMAPSASSLCSPEHDLLVQAIKNDQKFELIPSRVLRGEFPIAFVDKYVHWYNIDEDYLEFRPIEDLWTSSHENWRLTRAESGSKWRLMKAGISLVNIKSETARELFSILDPIEDPLWMHIIFHHSLSSLEVELPRLRLGFHLKPGESSIQSRQFPRMAIDLDQSLGTLVGLRNKLILKDENNGIRLVIVPEGDVSYGKHEDHVQITIDKDSACKIHAYSVDSQMMKLVDNGNLQSKLYLCYLHALTSFSLPDPFTQRTGTEQALWILDSAAVRSFDQLAQDNVKILGQIADLTPGRGYYPAHEKVMQTVNWSPILSFLTQHGGLYKSVQSIFSQAGRAKMFYPESYFQPPQLTHTESDLLERDFVRSSIYRVSGYGAEDHTIDYDTVYDARDCNQNPGQGLSAFMISSNIYNDRAALHYDIRSDLRAHLWSFLSKTSEIHGPDIQLQSSELRYDAGLLLHPRESMSKHWCALHGVFSQTGPRFDKFRLMIWLSTLAFARNADMKMIQTLASFFIIPEMVQISAPRISSFRLNQGTEMEKREICEIVRSALLPLHRCPEANLTPNSRESHTKFKQRQKREFLRNQNSAVDILVNGLVAQGHCETPTIPADARPISFRRYVDVSKVMNSVKPITKTRFDNYLFFKYLNQIETVISRQVVDTVERPASSFAIPVWNIRRRSGFIGIDDVFDFPAPLVVPLGTADLSDRFSLYVGVNKTSPRLAALIQRLEAQASSKYETKYVNDLRESLLSLQNLGQEYILQSKEDEVKEILLDHFSCCKGYAQKTYEAILSATNTINKVGTSSSGQRHTVLEIAAGVRQWPRLCPSFFLQQLTRARWTKISSDWKSCILLYGLALTELQRAERLLSSSANQADFIKELRNPGHTNWSPREYPESLLLEVESGIMIREVQEQIAGQMRYPASGRNTVMQLNMGEGKSSVIVPAIVAALADGSRLVRVVVAKPQSKQMFQMLISKLGGLIGKRIYHMPFSRSLRLGEADASAINNICRECMSNGGVLLVQPEHILSFKLMGLESLISGKEKMGHLLLNTQKLFETSCRDIIDESDENFSVKFELVYTMGMQRPIELSPDRWTCIHKVLDLVRIFAPKVKKEFPFSMEFSERCTGSFPRIRVLQPDAQRRLFDNIAEHICATGFNGFPIARQPEAVREAVFRYITESDLNAREVARVENQGLRGFWAETTSSTLLLLRGLIAGGVFPFVFGQKRWRVNYGLDGNRQPPTKLAVPYRAKDSPATRSEFSHPDVVIVLTFLSYYYGGLENEDLFLAFDHLLKSNHADIEYQAWVKDGPELGSAFRQLDGINLKDRFQCIEKVFSSLRFAKSAIDYFLTHIVFPKEMKEFPHKLSASGWDLGQIKAHPITGFSGTCDSQKTLPLDVEHLDLLEQKHTNALVLEYLLQPENSVTLIPPRSEGSCSDAELLLAMVTKMKPIAQVILDVGAQILELSNLGVAKQWLKMTPNNKEAQAVLFFNDSDELSVLDRKGHVEPLQISSFAKQLDVCLIYLDEVHTRGTDLRLPEYYRAAVTLGANLTKDRLVQACMRMRKLGKGQSVTFFVPPEIETKILARVRRPGNIDVSDVLSWAISETCIDMRRSMPLWAAQGQRFELQSTLWAEAPPKGEIKMSKSQAERFLENEAQTLENRYRPRSNTDDMPFEQTSQNANLNLIMERCREFDSLTFDSAKLQEEQERELSPEIEQERQVQKPAQAQPAGHLIHPDLISFVSTGTLINHSKAYKPAFESLRSTSAATHLDVSQFANDLLVTADFANTVQIVGASYLSDVYQRPVQWILTTTACSSSKKNIANHLMIISPHEAQELLPNIRKSKAVALHLYAPRPNLGFRALDGLDLYTVPAQPRMQSLPHRLILQLNLFAGQLYIGSFNEYVEMCKFLGLAWEKTEEGCVVAPDGFIIRSSNDQEAFKSGFSDSPVGFLKVLMTKIRRNCEGIEKTHMGMILDGGLLRRSDFGEQEDGFDRK